MGVGGMEKGAMGEAMGGAMKEGMGGAMGGLCAALMLPAQMLFSMINAPRSKMLLAATLSPPMLYLLSTPFFAAHFGAGVSVIMTASAAVVMFVIFTVLGLYTISTRSACLTRRAGMSTAPRATLAAFLTSRSSRRPGWG